MKRKRTSSRITKQALSIFDKLIRVGRIEPTAGLSMASSIRDGSSDAWGRSVIINRLVGAKAAEAETSSINED